MLTHIEFLTSKTVVGVLASKLLSEQVVAPPPPQPWRLGAHSARAKACHMPPAGSRRRWRPIRSKHTAQCLY